MAEPSLPTAAPDIPGQPFYDKTRLHLKDLIHKRHKLEKTLALQEELIYKKETEYLEETPQGNIITGFEAYTKGSSVVPGMRRGRATVEGNRVFSGCSVTFREGDSPAETAASTPIHINAPTPLSTTFLKGTPADTGSNAATPTSATSKDKSAGGKKNKKGAGAAEDSEGEERGVKKARTNFGAVRK